MRKLDKHKHLIGTYVNQDDERENLTIENVYVRENDDPQSLKETQKRIDQKLPYIRKKQEDWVTQWPIISDGDRVPFSITKLTFNS